MAYTTKWYEELPTPWDHDCRGKFCIHKELFDLDTEYKSTDGRQKFFKMLQERLEENGKLGFLRDNGVSLDSIRVTGANNQATFQMTIAVLVDLPHSLRTMYALRFTE